MFGRLFARRLSSLVTCIVQREGDTWQATWAADGRVPADFFDGSLTAATERATAEIITLYADQPQAAPAELQFAIYPWTDTSARVILDIDSDSDGFTACDIEGSGALVRGETLEALVREAEQTLPNPHDGMLRWVRPISTLQVS
jgi:hypothetical protein